MVDYNYMKPFKFFCQKVLPLVYDDSLSYYEVLCKMRDKLNEVIENTNKIPEIIKEMLDEEEIGRILSEMMDTLRSNIESNNEHDSATATTDYVTGNVLWWNDNLYEVIRDIEVGSAFIESGSNPNVKRITVEEQILKLGEDLSTAVQGLTEDLSEAVETLNGTITENVERIDGNIDNLTDVVDGEIEAREQADEDIMDYVNSIYHVPTPQDYGAIGDGVADDTNAIKAAIEENSVLYFPKGAYKITESITIDKFIEIYGDGFTQTFIRCYECDGFIVEGNNRKTHIHNLAMTEFTNADIIGKTHCAIWLKAASVAEPSNGNHIHDLLIVGFIQGIKLTHGWLSTINNVNMIGTRTGIYLQGQCVGINIDACTIGADDAHDNIACVNIIQGDSETAESINITNCHFSGAMFGIYCTNKVLYLCVTNNTLDQITDTALRLNEARNSIIANNWISVKAGSTTCIDTVDLGVSDNMNTVICDNVVFAEGGALPCIRINNNGYTIHDNILSSASNWCILVVGARNNLIITGNTCITTNTYAINITGENCVVANNLNAVVAYSDTTKRNFVTNPEDVVQISNPAFTAAPASGTWKTGDIVYNATPTAGGYIGWVKTAGGWKAFGQIAT